MLAALVTGVFSILPYLLERQEKKREGGSTRSLVAQVEPLELQTAGLGGGKVLPPLLPLDAWKQKPYFARIKGAGELSYRTINATSYVFDAEMEVNGPAGGGVFIRWVADGPDTLWLVCGPHDAKKAGITLWRGNADGSSGGQSEDFVKVGQRVHLRLIVDGERYTFFVDSRAVVRLGNVAKKDCSLRIWSDKDETDAVIHSCSLRELTQDDLELLKP